MTRQHTLITLSVYRYVHSCPSKEPTYPADLGTQHGQTITLKDIISGEKDSISKRRSWITLHRHGQNICKERTTRNIWATHKWLPWRTTTKRHVIWVKLTLFTGLWFSGRARLDYTEPTCFLVLKSTLQKLRAYAYHTQSDLIFIHSTYRMSWLSALGSIL